METPIRVSAIKRKEQNNNKIKKLRFQIEILTNTLLNFSYYVTLNSGYKIFLLVRNFLSHRRDKKMK